MTAQQIGLVRELSSVTCRCGSVKVPTQTFCRRCYYSLTRDQQSALYRRIGKGYEEAYAAAVESLVRKGRIPQEVLSDAPNRTHP